jgi:hypothetical protein
MTAGEVTVAVDLPAGKPSFQAYDSLKSRVCPTSPSVSLLVIQDHCSIMAANESRVTYSKVPINQWRNRTFSHDQLGHQLAFTKTDDEPTSALGHFW